MDDLTLCPLLPEDIEELLALDGLCFPTPWSREDFEQEVRNPAAYYAVLKSGRRIAAYGGMWLLPGLGHITTLAVHPDFRRRGLGKKLMQLLLEKARELHFTMVYLEVREHNTIARNLYKQCGFRFAGVEKGYYPDSGEDAFIMVCDPYRQAQRLTLRRAEGLAGLVYSLVFREERIGLVELAAEGRNCRILRLKLFQKDMETPALQTIADYAKEVLGAERLCVHRSVGNAALLDALEEMGFAASLCDAERLDFKL